MAEKWAKKMKSLLLQVLQEAYRRLTGLTGGLQVFQAAYRPYRWLTGLTGGLQVLQSLHLLQALQVLTGAAAMFLVQQRLGRVQQTGTD